jgi:hypothetical protein
MNAAALQAALEAAGFHGRVTAVGAVALLRVSAEDRVFEDPAARRTAVAIAAEHGFRNLALEVDG